MKWDFGKCDLNHYEKRRGREEREINISFVGEFDCFFPFNGGNKKKKIAA